MADKISNKGHLNVPASLLPPAEVEDDFRNSPHWRVLRIQAEFVDGWNFLADIKKSVTFFGSARFTEDNPWYQEARKLGKMLTDEGYSVVTGGGPGIMEAGNRGAQEGGGEGDSIGLDIQLPFEQRANPYIDRGIGFHYFFTRKVMLAFSAQAYCYFPGGFGTVDELSELVTLIQTKKMSSDIPMILIGKDFWQPFLDWIEQTVLAKYQAISQEDLNIYQLVDSAEEAYEIIKKSPLRTEFG
ncbi:MAG: TIGR00730 family Rossman fold protein [Patescibacteria group bacterium]